MHLALELLPQVVHRHAFRLKRGLELLLVLQALLFADVGHDLLELIVAEVQPELAPRCRSSSSSTALTSTSGVTSASIFFSCSSFFSRRDRPGR